tara:strand:- start:1650 stop:2720 length:1071 start_codon:yes stop_codon:yes gene_type:complete
MKSALSLARRGLGNVAPNPAVGCLIVKEGIVLGRGWTQPGGRPHAETVALKQAGVGAVGATAYVTLEPCAHYAVTPPCAEALVKAGIVRVVIAIGDSDKRVSGQGVNILREAGVSVVEDVLSDEAQLLNRGFFLTVTEDRPLFSLKAATSLDGKIATSSGESKWITESTARRYGHMLRAQHDAILVGVNTVIADDPELTCRIYGLEKASPIRIVLDSCLRMPSNAKMLRGVGQTAVWVVTNERMRNSEESLALLQRGVDLIFVKNTAELKDVASSLRSKGVTRVLVEGGAHIHASFLRAQLCDFLYHFIAAKVIGDDGLGAIGSIGLAQLQDAPHLKLVDHQKVGEDLLATYRNAG